MSQINKSILGGPVRRLCTVRRPRINTQFNRYYHTTKRGRISREFSYFFLFFHGFSGKKAQNNEKSGRKRDKSKENGADGQKKRPALRTAKTV